ncbi:MAG: hypothetical protein ACRC6I_04375 [Paracoccaceae bacterium]|uniref:hypothetical protein n=1 Tax=Tabrizicola sp. TaxID=2005166 RepID=UPI003F3908F8
MPIAQALRFTLPRNTVARHCTDEATEAGPGVVKQQSILIGMSTHAGFADIIAMSGTRDDMLARGLVTPERLRM